MLHTCQCAGFDRKVLEAQEEEERERQRKKDRKRDRRVSTLPDCRQNESAHTAHSEHENGLNNAIVFLHFVHHVHFLVSVCFQHFLLCFNVHHLLLSSPVCSFSHPLTLY